MTDNNIMLAIFCMTFVLTVSSQTIFQSQLWVTKILSNTLDEYTPDGGIVCKRHGLEYRKGLKDLKLWATQSEFDYNFTHCAMYE